MLKCFGNKLTTARNLFIASTNAFFSSLISSLKSSPWRSFLIPAKKKMALRARMLPLFRGSLSSRTSAKKRFISAVLSHLKTSRRNSAMCCKPSARWPGVSGTVRVVSVKAILPPYCRLTPAGRWSVEPAVLSGLAPGTNAGRSAVGSNRGQSGEIGFAA